MIGSAAPSEYDRADDLKRHLTATGKGVGAGHLLCAAIVTGVLAGQVDSAGLIVWMTAVIASIAVRTILLRRPGSSFNALRLAAIVNAAAWGFGLLALSGQLELSRLLLVMVIFAGLVAAGATTLAADAVSFRCYIVLMLAPLEVALFRQGLSPVPAGAATIVPLFALIVLQIHRVARGQILARFDAERQASRQREFLSALLESAPTAIVTVDVDDTVLSVNPSFETLFGYRPEEVMGHALNSLIVPDSGRSGAASLTERVVSGESIVAEAERVRRDGTKVTVRISAARAKGAAAGTVFVLYDDITSVRAAESKARRALEEARTIAEEGARAKSDFLANMSHEIRTPMNGVLGMAGLLLDSELDAEQREFAGTILRSGESLLAIINDILDFSKIEAGKLVIEPLSFDLRVAIEDVVDLVAPRAEEKGLTLGLRYEPGLPTRFVADAGRIRQVVLNLVGNAIKFTDRGHVLIGVARAAGSARGTVVRISIEDSGIGLSLEVQARLFQKFSQADASTTRKYGGTGLGLAISRQLAEAMGGSVGVDSQPGHGSTFWFELPLPLDLAEPPLAPAPVELAGVRALVVDDMEVNRRVLSEQLSHWGMVPTVVPSAEAGLEAIEAAARAGTPYRIVIVDYLMAEMNGEAFGRAVRARADGSDIRLLLMTSCGNRGEGARFEAAGFDGYFVRPVRQAILEQALGAVLAGPASGRRIVTRHSLAEAGLPRQRPEPAASPVPGAAAPRPVRVLLAEDHIVNQRLAVRMLERLGCRVDVAANGAEAVAMTTQFDYDLILMDCEMPELDGFEATAAIRNGAGRGSRTPIIAMTANAMAGDRERCLTAGMDDYLAKPVRPAELALMVERWQGTSAHALAGP
ncbi:MAG: response regulator [Gemmatimonadota bacterium]